jgi:hypothetical protein
VLEHLGTAFPLYRNFAISGMERLAGEVRSAPHRREPEGTQARSAVEQQFRSEMCVKASLAMSVLGVPGPAAQKYEPLTIWPAKGA